MLEGSSEVRAPLTGKFGAVAFFDYGNVWSKPLNFSGGDLRYAAGPGLRYLTPIGPARVDFGYQLNRFRTCASTASLKRGTGASISASARHSDEIPNPDSDSPSQRVHVANPQVASGLRSHLHPDRRRRVDGGHRDADDLVQGMAARLHRPQAEDYVNGRLSIGRLDGNLFFGVELEDVDVTMNGKTVVALKESASTTTC